MKITIEFDEMNILNLSRYLFSPDDRATLKFIKEAVLKMANFGQETLDLLKQIDAATTAAAGRVEAKLNAALAAAGDRVTPEDQAAIRASVSTELDHLKGIAADPEAPVPPAPPTVVEP